jgi:hypothetical protein
MQSDNLSKPGLHKIMETFRGHDQVRTKSTIARVWKVIDNCGLCLLVRPHVNPKTIHFLHLRGNVRSSPVPHCLIVQQRQSHTVKSLGMARAWVGSGQRL